MKKSNLIKLISLALAILIILTGGCLYFYNQAQDYRLALENTYKHSLQDLNSYVNNIYSDLDKGLYIGTAYQLSNISAKLLSDSRAATMCLSSLPASQLHLDNTFKFLSQVGDFAAYLNKRYHNENKISDEEYKSLGNLKKYAKQLDNYISKVENDVLKNNIDLINNNVIEDETKKVNRKNNNINFKDLEKQFESYPKLIYDGPFSDSVYKKTPEMTKDKPEISQEQARKIAALATGIDENKLSSSEEKNSNINLYCFNDKDISIGVTKKGGYLCYILKSRAVKKREIDSGTAIERARKYINEVLKISDIEQCYYEIENNCCIVNFAVKQDDIIIYPDMIKVAVALDNAEILSVDSKSYINNHKDRKIYKAKKTQQEANGILSKYLTVLKDPRRAIIPTEGGNEIDTYEFICRGDNDETVLVYINSETLEEEQILILLEEQEGLLTI